MKENEWKELKIDDLPETKCHGDIYEWEVIDEEDNDFRECMASGPGKRREQLRIYHFGMGWKYRYRLRRYRLCKSEPPDHMEIKKAINFLWRFTPCEHEYYELCGAGDWGKCEQCGETFLIERLDKIKIENKRFIDSVSLLKSAIIPPETQS